MRKIFTLFAAMLVALTVSAAVKPVSPGQGNFGTALSGANDGDTLLLAAGTYVDIPDAGYLFFDNKSVIVKAAAGAEVILQPKVQVRLKGAARAEFLGVKIDCSHVNDINSYSCLFYQNDNTDGKCLVFNDCEIYGWNVYSALIYAPSDRKMDSIKINNCYIHDCYKSIIYYMNANLIGIEITNSTIANITKGSAYWSAPIHIEATNGKVLIDHCTFYNAQSISLSYGTIYVKTITDPVLSNSIMVLSATEDMCATNFAAGGSVKNTLTYYYDNWQPYGHYESATVTDCLEADPLFQDAENGDYTLSYGSPALTAGTDGKAIGDPRWVPNFYLTGTAAGATDAWTGHEIACAGTSYTIKNLAAGSYQLKLTRNGTWTGDNNVYGYDALSAKIGGLYKGTDDAYDNICFTLADAGDVKVTFIYDEPLVFKVEGDFVMQNIQLGGSWASSGVWGDDLRTFVPSEDKLTATLTMNFTKNYYEFKVVENGTWNGKWAGADDKHYYYTRTVTSADNFEENKQSLVITPDVAGDYVFTWTYATRVLEVAFPAAPDTTYYIAGSFTDWGDNKVEMDESAGTYSKTININTTANLEYKVVRVAGFSEVWYGLANASSMTKDDCTDWVIGGGEAAIGITTDETGDYAFIFNPAETKVSLVYPSSTVAIDNTVVGEKAVKVLRNGQLFIEKDGKTYNVLGTVVK